MMRQHCARMGEAGTKNERSRIIRPLSREVMRLQKETMFLDKKNIHFLGIAVSA